MLNQLPLAFKLLDNATFSSFFRGHGNQEALFGLQQFVKTIRNKNYNNNFIENSINPNLSCSIQNCINDNFLYLWGKPGVGKTHLLQATCNYALEYNIQAMYISLEQIVNVDHTDHLYEDIKEINNKNNNLSGLETVELLCLDNLQFIIGNIELQKEVFYLFNKIRSLGNKLIIASQDSPLHIPLTLLDLKSRMSWGITYLLSELSEAEKISALMMRAKQIGLDLRLEVAKFLLSRVSRSTKDLFALLEVLDNATLAAKRKLTVPFIKDFLKI